MSTEKEGLPKQKQNKQPGERDKMDPVPQDDDSSYISGQTLHPNGGVVVNG